MMTGAWLVQAAEEGEQGLRAQDLREAPLRQQLGGFSDQTQLPPYTAGETEAGRRDPPCHKP